MTHADVRVRLRAYADGTLGETEAEIVRAHLASGCAECLRDVFTRPVGIPRAPIVVRRTSTAPLAALGAGTAIVVAAALFATLRGGPDGGVAPAPVRDAPSSGLDAEIARLRDACDAAEARAQARIGRLEARLGESRQPGEPSPERASAPPPTSPPPADPDAVPRWLEDLLASEGTRSAPLVAAAAGEGASGYAVWNPARGIVVVSASGLPGDPQGAGYRLRVTLDDGTVVPVGGLAASERGTLTVTAALPAGGRSVATVELFRDPEAKPVMSARLRVRARPGPSQPAPWRIFR